MTRFALISGDFVTTGGMDRANHALALELARRGHETTVITHRAAPDLAAHPRVHVVLVRKPLGSYFLGQWGLAAAGQRHARQAFAAGRVVVNGGNCPVADINWVHYVHAAYEPGPISPFARRLRKRLERAVALRAEQTATRAARVVVCNSDRTRRDVIDRLGVRPERAVTVYYGIDPEQFAPADVKTRSALRQRLGWPSARPVVLFVGGIGDRRKGFDTAFTAWQLLGRTWDAQLLVVGAGADRSYWEERVAGAGLAESIRFLGFRSDVPDLLRAADMLVAPTRYEAYGLGVHEALCCGLPALVSASAGVAERYPAELAGLLLHDADDANDLAARLTRWRADLDGWRNRVARFAADLREYTWADMAGRFLIAVE